MSKEEVHSFAEKLANSLPKDELQQLYDFMADEAMSVGPLLSAIYAECYVRWPNEYRESLLGMNRNIQEALEFVKNRNAQK